MKQLKKAARLGIVLMVSAVLSITTFAHSGRTDSNGGHRDNKNKSGLGSYHYHCGGYPAHLHEDGVCPYTSTTYVATSSSSSIGISSNAAQATKPTYTINTQSFNLDGKMTLVNTIIKDGVSLVELRTLADGMGISLEYNAATSVVIGRYNQGYVSLVIGSKSAKANDIKTELTVAPVEKDGRIYVPARYIAESFGMTVNYDNVSGITYIMK